MPLQIFPMPLQSTAAIVVVVIVVVVVVVVVGCVSLCLMFIVGSAAI